jgi:hypothetical protein
MLANLGGGATPDATTSFVGYRGCKSEFTVPTGGNVDKAGNKPVYITQLRSYARGRDGYSSASIRYEMDSFTTAYFSVSEGTEATRTSYQDINAYFANGGTKEFRIKNQTTDDYFYYGKGGSGAIYAINSSNATVSTLTTADSLVGDFYYYYGPTAPQSPSVSQPDASLPNVTVSWTAPSSDGGSAITGYRVEYSTSSTFTSVSTVNTTGTGTSTTITGLTSGATYYFRVAAYNLVVNAGNTWSAYSTTTNIIIATGATTGDLDGWTATNKTNVTETFTRAAIPGVTTDLTWQLKHVPTANVSYSNGENLIERELTGLKVGRSYTFSAKAILLTSGRPLNIIKLGVSGIGAGSTVSLSSTSTWATIPSYTFTATSTSHTLLIESGEAISASSGTTPVELAIRDIIVTLAGVGSDYFLQDTNFAGNLAEHYDLATQSVGATWWVDKINELVFQKDFSYDATVGTWSDVRGTGKLEYSDIVVGFSSKNVVNDVQLTNYGVRTAYEETSAGKFEDFDVIWNETNATSQSDWGRKRLELNTNIYTEVLAENLVENPSLIGTDALVNAYNGEPTKWAMKKRYPITAVPSGDLYAIRMYCTAADNAADLWLHDETVGGGVGMPVDPGLTYTASAKVIRDVSTTPSNSRAKMLIRFYNADGTLLASSEGTPVTLSTLNSWYTITHSATAPSGAVSAAIRIIIDRSDSSNFTVGHMFWIANFVFSPGTNTEFFHGSYADTTSAIYQWTGQEFGSISRKLANVLDNRANEILTAYADPETLVKTITWNAQDNLLVAAKLDIGSKINIEFNGTTKAYRVVGLNHQISPTSWVITIEVGKV